MIDEFTEARLNGLKDRDNEKTSPREALALALSHVEDVGCSGFLPVVFEDPEGGVVIFQLRPPWRKPSIFSRRQSFS